MRKVAKQTEGILDFLSEDYVLKIKAPKKEQVSYEDKEKKKDFIDLGGLSIENPMHILEEKLKNTKLEI